MTTPKTTLYTLSYKSSHHASWLPMSQTYHNLSAARQYITQYMIDQLHLHPSQEQRYMIDQRGVGPVETGELLTTGRLTRTTLSYKSRNLIT